MAQDREQTPQDTALMSRLNKAVEMARSALTLANMTTVVGDRAIGQPHPDALPIAILAAAVFNEVKPDPQH